MKTDKLFENVNRTIIMRDLSDGVAFSNFARLVWKENILSALIFGKKLQKEKDSFPDLSVLTCTDYMRRPQWINLKTPSLRFRLWTKNSALRFQIYPA